MTTSKEVRLKIRNHRGNEGLQKEDFTMRLFLSDSVLEYFLKLSIRNTNRTSHKKDAAIDTSSQTQTDFFPAKLFCRQNAEYIDFGGFSSS